MLVTRTPDLRPLGLIRVSILLGCEFYPCVHLDPSNNILVNGYSFLGHHTTCTLMDAHFRSAKSIKLLLGICHWTSRVSHLLYYGPFRAILAQRSHKAIKELKATGQFSDMNLQTDEDEHSIEMHLPYVRKVFEGYINPPCCCSPRIY